MPERQRFSALPDPSGRRLLESLAGRESAWLTELAAQFALTRQAVSRHPGAPGTPGWSKRGA